MRTKLVNEALSDIFKPKSKSKIEESIKILGPFKDILIGIMAQSSWYINISEFQKPAEDSVHRPMAKGLDPLYYMRWSPEFFIQFAVPKDINEFVDEYTIDYYYNENVMSMDIYTNAIEDSSGHWSGGSYIRHPLNFTTFKELKKLVDFMKNFEYTDESFRLLTAKTGILSPKTIKIPYPF